MLMLCYLGKASDQHIEPNIIIHELILRRRQKELKNYFLSLHVKNFTSDKRAELTRTRHNMSIDKNVYASGIKKVKTQPSSYGNELRGNVALDYRRPA